MRWQFTYVDLWLGADQTIDAVTDSKAYIAQLGKEGWEPVTQIEFKFRKPGFKLGAETTVQQLMFKRPVPWGKSN